MSITPNTEVPMESEWKKEIFMLTMLGYHMIAVLDWGADRERRRGRVVRIRP